MDKEFCLYTHSSELCLERYSFDHEDISAMANFFVAQSSIDELKEKLDVPIDLENCITQDEMDEHMDKWRTEMLQNMSADERAYYDAQERFEDETESIRQRYWKSIVEQVEKKHIAAIRDEYKTRAEQ